MKINWLERTLIQGRHLVLCLSDKEYTQVCDELKIPTDVRDTWLHKEGRGATHHLVSPSGDKCCVVCIRTAQGQTGLSVTSILIHEAVHVWQDQRDYMSESSPSVEFEAYSIERIAMTLMEEFARRTNQLR